MLPGWFKRAEGTASVVFIVMAVAGWLLLPFGHPVYAAVVPPVIAAGIALAVWRARRARADARTIKPYSRS